MPVPVPALDTVDGKHGICLVFRGGSGVMAELNGLKVPAVKHGEWGKIGAADCIRHVGRDLPRNYGWAYSRNMMD
ncbi:hypothetical protein D3C76_1582260 [compost metagenome]